MKKRILIISTLLVILSLLIFGFTNLYNVAIKTDKSEDRKALFAENQDIDAPNLNDVPDLYYGVDARFEAVKKADVHNATTIYDFLNEGEKQQIEHIYSVDVIIVKNNQLSQIHASGTSAQLTSEQLKILRSTDYFSHFTVRTEFRGKNLETGVMEDKFFGPHITVVPEKQATYADGHDALITYLKENSLSAMNVIKDDKLNAVKFSFIVSKDGKVTHVKHDAMATGYPSIDNKLIELLNNIPGKWIPAENANGKKLEQELVFTFGPRDGC